VHLPDRLGAVREQLKTLVAHYEIESLVWERHRQRIPFFPFDRSIQRAGFVQHTGVHIKSDDSARSTYHRDSLACHDTGTASYVQNALSWLGVYSLKEVRRPWAEYGRHHLALVYLSR